MARPSPFKWVKHSFSLLAFGAFVGFLSSFIRNWPTAQTSYLEMLFEFRLRQFITKMDNEQILFVHFIDYQIQPDSTLKHTQQMSEKEKKKTTSAFALINWNLGENGFCMQPIPMHNVHEPISIDSPMKCYLHHATHSGVCGLDSTNWIHIHWICDFSPLQKIDCICCGFV